MVPLNPTTTKVFRSRPKAQIVLGSGQWNWQDDHSELKTAGNRLRSPKSLECLFFVPLSLSSSEKTCTVPCFFLSLETINRVESSEKAMHLMRAWSTPRRNSRIRSPLPVCSRVQGGG